MKVHISAGVVLALAAQGCTQPVTFEVRLECPADQSSDYFFPKGSLRPERHDLDEFSRRWYSKHLAAMHEPSLSCGGGDDEYRFTWLRTFHHPVAVRVTTSRATSKSKVVAIELSGAGGYSPGEEERRVERELSDAEVSSLNRSFEQERFWSLRMPERELGLDGAEWIIEARVGTRYRVLTVWSPDDGAVYRLGLLFLSFSGWTFSETY